MPAGKPKPSKVLKLRWKRTLPKRPVEKSFDMRLREFRKRYSKVPNAFKYANFRISSLIKGGISKDAALVQVMRELHSEPRIRPWLGNEKYGWVLEVTTKKDGHGTWRKPTIFKNPEMEWKETGNHDSAYEEIGGRHNLEENQGERQADAVTGKIGQVKNILEMLEKVSKPEFRDLVRARKNYGKVVSLILGSKEGMAAARGANRHVGNAVRRGKKAEFFEIIRRTKELADLAERDLAKNRK